MGLDYLNKKTWHTGSIKNMEKVWIREQEEAEKRKELSERAKRLQEEKHNEELKKLQAEAGYISKTQLARMEWMYDWEHKQEEARTAEEYLLGKPVDLNAANAFAGGSSSNLSKRNFVPTQEKEERTNQKCEDFSKLHEDPLFEIRIEEEKRKEEMRDNPLELRKLLEQIEEQKADAASKELERSRSRSQEKSDSGHKKKKNKKNKKSKKSKKHHRDRSNSSSSEASSASNRQDNSDRISETSRAFSTASSSGKSVSSEIYEKLMHQKLGPLLVKDEHGNMKPDFGLMKRLARPPKRDQVDARPMTEAERLKLIEEMKEDALEIKTQREKEHENDYATEKSDGAAAQNPGAAKFLKDMKHDIYNNEKNLGDLADRLGRNRNNFKRMQEETNTFK